MKAIGRPTVVASHRPVVERACSSGRCGSGICGDTPARPVGKLSRDNCFPRELEFIRDDGFPYATVEPFSNSGFCNRRVECIWPGSNRRSGERRAVEGG